MNTFAPTTEQQAIIDAAKTGGNLTIEAGAGTGKTSTLQFLADALGRKRGVYLAYNKSIATEAEKKFPANVLCKTSHGLAYGSVGKHFRHRLNGPRIPANRAAVLLGIHEPVKLGAATPGVDDVTLTEKQLASLVGQTVQRFCYSDDREITPWHVPFVNGVAREAQRELARYIAPIAQRAWDTDLTRKEGQLRFTHDMYLKMWILTDPQLGTDYVLLDEAQDSNPAVAGLVSRQQGQKILVGDRCQAIYGWRGATDAMQSFDGDRYYLSQSFRFGPAVAAEANKWLTVLDAELRLTGFDQIPSRLGELDRPDAILCRSNGGAISQVIAELGNGRRTALVGGGKDIKAFALAAQQLQAGRPTDHPELMAFGYWSEVQEYVQGGEGSDLKVLVDLVDRHGADELAGLVDRLTDEKYADVVVSTAHKAKGREWKQVRIHSDFREPKQAEDGKEPTVPREDAMLAYVAVTRAQRVLDREGLAWVDNFVGQAPAPAEQPAVEVPAPAPAPVVVIAPVAPASPEAVACDRQGCPGDHPAATDGYTAHCVRPGCGRYYRDCVCRLIPDRRPLVAVA